MDRQAVLPNSVENCTNKSCELQFADCTRLTASRIKTEHGSFSQEKALVTGYEAANATLSYLGFEKKALARIIPLEEDEVHIVLARRAYKAVERLRTAVNPFSEYFML